MSTHEDKSCTSENCCCCAIAHLANAAACVHDQHCHCAASGDDHGCNCCAESLKLILDAMDLHIKCLRGACATMKK